MALHAKKFISFVKWELTSCLGNRDLRTLLRVGTEAVGAFSILIIVSKMNLNSGSKYKMVNSRLGSYCCVFFFYYKIFFSALND